MVFILVKLKWQTLGISLNLYTLYDILYQSTKSVYIIDMKTPHPGTPDARCILLLFFQSYNSVNIGQFHYVIDMHLFFYVICFYAVFHKYIFKYLLFGNAISRTCATSIPPTPFSHITHI